MSVKDDMIYAFTEIQDESVFKRLCRSKMYARRNHHKVKPIMQAMVQIIGAMDGSAMAREWQKDKTFLRRLVLRKYFPTPCECREIAEGLLELMEKSNIGLTPTSGQ